MDIASMLTLKRKIRARKKERTAKLVSFIILFIVCFFFAFPFVYMLGTSFKTSDDLIKNPLGLFPKSGGWTLENYSGFIIRDGKLDNVPKWMLNSFLLCISSIILTLLYCSLIAFAFVFLKFRGRDKLYLLLIMSLTIPGVIGTTVIFSMYANIGSVTNLLNSKAYIYFWIAVPGVSSVYNVYLLKNSFKSIPKDIIESARTDGASNFRIYASIVLPLAKSTLLLITLFSFVGSWNSLLWPQLLLSGKPESFQTITVALTGYTNQQDGWNAKAVAMATSVFSMIPIIIIFALTQRKMIDGMASTGIKG